MIKQIIKCLQENSQVNGWLINEKTTETSEQFYVIHKLETTRMVKTNEISVTVYHKFEENGVKYLGSSSFLVSHKLSKTELVKLIDDAVYAAGFIKNQEYQLVDNHIHKNFKAKEPLLKGVELLNEMATIFFNASSDVVKFNSLELFYEKNIVRVINSNGVDLKKTEYSVMIEAIPSYNGEQKVELYKDYYYNDFDLNKVKEDAQEAVTDVINRYYATPLKDVSKIDVILKNNDAGSFFRDLIANYSYAGVYKHATDKKLGDAIQKNIVGDTLTIGLKNKTKAHAFDADGVIVKPVQVIKNGFIANYYGNNQYANYLNIEPTGNMSTIVVDKGKTNISKMKKKPYLEIIALSGIQIESYSGYIGGEVRLALYFDGKEVKPVSGFSFSGNIDNCLSNITLSKETTDTKYYEGPKYIKLIDMDII